MRMQFSWKSIGIDCLLLMLGLVVLTACHASGEAELRDGDTHQDEHHAEDDIDNHEHEASTEDHAEMSLPSLTAADLGDSKLRVVATTSIIGDVVGQVGGEAIDLTTLMPPGQDPHGYEPAAQDLTAVAQAHLIFMNGWNLEEGLVDDIENIAGDVPVLPISAGIEPHHMEEDEAEEDDDDHDDHDDHDHGLIDPHVWFDIDNVVQWTVNAEQWLSEIDPANADLYAANAAAYREQLSELAADVGSALAAIPVENRLIVTNHDALSYFIDAYDFELLGTVIPAATTVADPSASDLVELIKLMSENNVCTIFTDTTVNSSLAETVADELGGCEVVQVLSLYTGAVGPAGSGAESYIDMYRTNVEIIVAGLQ